MKKLGLIYSLGALAVCLSCSPPVTPVQESGLAGEWQRTDKPAVSMVFARDGTFCGFIAGQRVLGGNYRLLNGEQIVLEFDASSPKPGFVTNRVFMLGEELRIIPAGGNTERYKRIEQEPTTDSPSKSK